MKGTCKSCLYWNAKRHCKVLNGEVIIPEQSSISGWCEGGVVEVEARVSFFSIKTDANFGCLHYKKSK